LKNVFTDMKTSLTNTDAGGIQYVDKAILPKSGKRWKAGGA
jgi:hypothetical protein